MTAGAPGFAASIRAFAEKCEKRTSFVVRSVGFNFILSVQRETPVKTGMARANWFPSKGEPFEGTIEFEGGGAAATAEVMSRAGQVFSESNVAGGGVFWISNNLPYIVPLEEGWSTQGRLFFARAVAGVPEAVEQFAAEARRAIP